MAIFYSEHTAKKAKKSTACLTLSIQSLDYQGLGVAKFQGKTYFVENALPDEIVEAKIREEKSRFGKAQAVKFLQKSAKRLMPFCPHYAKCGGCQMQHIPLEMQREIKQQTLIQRLQRLQPYPINIKPMLIGEDRHYRRRARLSIEINKDKLSIGFRQAHSNQIIPINECAILIQPLATLLPAIQAFFTPWKNKKNLGHIELVYADNEIVFLLRYLGKLTAQEQHLLQHFAENHSLALFLMNDNSEITQITGEAPFYKINNLTLHFSVRDFIQINSELNLQMVNTALDWLELNENDRVLDLFCGMGNFSLPIALKAKQVVGIEGVAAMVKQAQQNAKQNNLTNAQFYTANLDEPFQHQEWAQMPFNKVLLDPARGGALFAIDHICALQPQKIVYVSCNPATLVRDSEKLIERGYQLVKCAMIDMFPHTGHLESISLFEKSV